MIAWLRGGHSCRHRATLGKPSRRYRASVNAEPGMLVALARVRETLLMANRTSSRFRAYALRLLTGSAVVALLVIAGCGQLAEKERELTFRVVPGTASWFGGLPQGVEETDLAIEANGKP